MSRNQRLTFLGIAAVIAVVAIVIAVSSGGSDDKSAGTTSAADTTGTSSGGATATTTTAQKAAGQTITVVGGKPEGGVRPLDYDKGDTVDLTIESDTADEVHIHGYDLHKDVEKGGSVHFRFKATIDGEFEIELEDAKQQLAALRVHP